MTSWAVRAYHLYSPEFLHKVIPDWIIINSGLLFLLLFGILLITKTDYREGEI